MRSGTNLTSVKRKEMTKHIVVYFLESRDHFDVLKDALKKTLLLSGVKIAVLVREAKWIDELGGMRESRVFFIPIAMLKSLDVDIDHRYKTLYLFMELFSMENVLFSLCMTNVPCRIEELEAVADSSFITMFTRIRSQDQKDQSQGQDQSLDQREEGEFMFVKTRNYLIPLTNVSEDDASYYPFKRVSLTLTKPSITLDQIINVDAWFERCDMLFISDVSFPSPDFNVTILVDEDKEPGCVMLLRKSNADLPPPDVINVFIDFNILDFFMEKLLRKLDRTKVYTLYVSACSDSTSLYYCTKKYKEMFDENLIKHVYTTNLVGSDPRVTL